MAQQGKLDLQCTNFWISARPGPPLRRRRRFFFWDFVGLNVNFTGEQFSLQGVDETAFQLSYANSSAPNATAFSLRDLASSSCMSLFLIYRQYLSESAAANAPLYTK